MRADANLFFRIGSGFFASALIKLGLDSLKLPERAAREFRLPATTRETLAYQPVWGIRDLGFGTAILALLAADYSDVLPGGRKSAAMVTAIGSCVGMGDSILVSAAGGEGARGHAIGASGMFAMAFGLWVSS